MSGAREDVWTPAKDVAEVFTRIEEAVWRELEVRPGVLTLWAATVHCATPEVAKAFVEEYLAACVGCGDPEIAWPAATAEDLIGVRVHVFRMAWEGAMVGVLAAFLPR